MQTNLGHLPLYFVENQGQLDEQVAYYIQGIDKTVYFTAEGVTFSLNRGEPHVGDDAHDRLREFSLPTRWTVKLDFLGANPNVRPVAQEPTEAVISYFKGQPDEWQAGLRTYHRLVYSELWPGIDLVYYGTMNQMKYEFIVKPGSDPGAIRLVYRGATDVWLNAAGQMEVSTPVGGFRDDTPVAYQNISGQRVSVSMAYALEMQVSPTTLNPHEVGDNTQVFGFAVGGYDPTRPLILDPAVLVYAGYIGGAGADLGKSIAVDGVGNAYITGDTSSDPAAFPVVGGPDVTYNGGGDAFVAKVNAAGTALVYAGYIGGTGDDFSASIAVDGAGNVHITGYTNSDFTTFPVLGGPDLTYNGNADAFVAKVNAAGTALVYAGYIGGAGADRGTGIAVDGAGNVYVTGHTYSDQTTFPVLGGPDLTNNGLPDAFVAKVNAAGTALVYAGYIGGAGGDYGMGIAVDGAGNAHITGYTNSDSTTFPELGGPDLTYNGNADAFVAKVNAAGTALVYAGYIGGASEDIGRCIAVDGAGNAYVTGHTFSDQTTFPEQGGPDLTYNGNADAFVAKVNAAGTVLDYAGYIGGAGGDVGFGIAVDEAGNAYVTGSTGSDQTTFPVLIGPDLTYNGSDYDAFLAKMTASGTAMIYAGYIGGAGRDVGLGIVVDGAANAYVTGSTDSNETTFPVLNGPDLTHNGNTDAFMVKIVDTPNLTKPPIILLPGIMGSKLANSPKPDSACHGRTQGEVWPNLQVLMGGFAQLIPYNQGLNTLVLSADGRQAANDCDIIQPTEVLWNTSDIPVAVKDYYGDVDQELRSLGYSVYSFPYDWRLDLKDTATRLDAFIQEHQWSRVILLGHSMGGLLARTYISVPARASKVQAVISVGTPYWGSPTLAISMRDGSNPFPWFPIFMDRVPSPTLIRQIIRNSPGAMQLLPSQAYFDHNGLNEILGPNRGYFIGNGESLAFDTWSATRDYYSEGGQQNPDLLTAAASFHGELDLMTPGVIPPGLQYYALRSAGRETPMTVMERRCFWSRTGNCLSVQAWAGGDGTVPYPSAGWGLSGEYSGSAQVCTYGPGSSLAEHGELLSDPIVIADVKQILAYTTGQTTLLTTTCSQEAAETTLGVDHIQTIEGQAAGDHVFVLELWGDVAASVNGPSGWVIGSNGTEVFNTIPNGRFDQTADGARFLLPGGITYTLAMTSTTGLLTQLRVVDYQQAGAESIYAIRSQATFLDIPFTVNGTASAQFDMTGALPALSLTIRDSGGVVVATRAPDSVVDQAGLTDATAPVTQLAVQGAQDSLGFYRGSVTVTLAASDVGTGVAKTYYSLDGGQRWLTYAGPVTVAAEAVPVFLASSLDHNGNAEYPAIVQRLQPHRLFVPLLRR